MKVRVEDDYCCASGSCVAICPEVFGQAQNGLVRLLLTTPPEALHDKVLHAAASCPSKVIVVTKLTPKR